ncbi:unnamed protein product [Urochloa humidicola]
MKGETETLQSLVMHDPSVLDGTTRRGSTCLHISAIHGHEEFCMDALALNQSLLGTTNLDNQTPLLTAVTSGHVSLASALLRRCSDQHLSEAILKQDSRGFNVLHHAIRSGHRELALELIEAEPALSQAVNKYNESPMFMAVMRNYEDVFEKLLGTPDSAHRGAYGYNALHAAVSSGNSAIAKRILDKRPGLATEISNEKSTPVHLAVVWDKVDVLRVMLEHDPSLGYLVSADGFPLLVSAAYRGHDGVARELLKHCPDAPYFDANGWTCLHQAINYHHIEFMKFILRSPQMCKLVNIRGGSGGDTAHLAVRQCNPEMVAALLLHQDIDVTMINSKCNTANWILSAAMDHGKTLNWNKVSMLLLKADPQAASSIDNLHKATVAKVTELSRKEIKSLTQSGEVVRSGSVQSMVYILWDFWHPFFSDGPRVPVVLQKHISELLFDVFNLGDILIRFDNYSMAIPLNIFSNLTCMISAALIHCHEWNVKLHLLWKYTVLLDCSDCEASNISDQWMVVVPLQYFLQFKYYIADYQVASFDDMVPTSLILQSQALLVDCDPYIISGYKSLDCLIHLVMKQLALYRVKRTRRPYKQIFIQVLYLSSTVRHSVSLLLFLLLHWYMVSHLVVHLIHGNGLGSFSEATFSSHGAKTEVLVFQTDEPLQLCLAPLHAESVRGGINIIFHLHFYNLVIGDP